MPVNFLVNFLL